MLSSGKESYYRLLFVISAIWNIGLSLGFLFLTGPLLVLFSLPPPGIAVWFQLFFALVLVFGLGYYWVSRNLDKNRGVVGIGVIGKLLVFLILGYYWFVGSLSGLAASAGIADLIFAILFLEFLIHHKSSLSSALSTATLLENHYR